MKRQNKTEEIIWQAGSLLLLMWPLGTTNSNMWEQRQESNKWTFLVVMLMGHSKKEKKKKIQFDGTWLKLEVSYNMKLVRKIGTKL